MQTRPECSGLGRRVDGCSMPNLFVYGGAMSNALERLLKCVVSELATEKVSPSVVLELVLSEYQRVCESSLRRLVIEKLRSNEEISAESNKFVAASTERSYGDELDGYLNAERDHDDTMSRLQDEAVSLEESAGRYARSLLDVVSLAKFLPGAIQAGAYESKESVINMLQGTCDLKPEDEESGSEILARMTRYLLSQGDFAPYLPQPKRWKDMTEEERNLRSAELDAGDDIPF